MFHLPRALSRSVVLLIALTVLATQAFADVDRDVKQRSKLRKKIQVALEKENYPKALKRFEQQVALVPRHAGVRYNHACVLALAGQKDAALDALAAAADLGSQMGEYAHEDTDLESLRDEPRFEVITAAMNANQEAWERRTRRLHEEIPVADAKPFDTLSGLVAEFEFRRTENRAQRSLLYWPEMDEAKWQLIHERIAALKRYMQDHPDADSLEHAAIDLVRQTVAYSNSYRIPWGVEDGMFAYREAMSFVERFPESEHMDEVLLIAGQSRQMARPILGPDEADSETAADKKTRQDEADRALARLITNHVGTEAATKACVWRMKIAYERAGKSVTSEVEEHYQAFCSACGSDEELLDYAWERARGPLFELESENFQAVDLDGLEWNRATMAGKIVLVDFWATWCGPCMQELPNLKAAYDKYSGDGFEILGVSLDGEDKDAFLASLEEHGIVWPQIYDGQGWSAELAERYRVKGIPATVLVARDGSVAGVDLRGDELIERVTELIAAENSR